VKGCYGQRVFLDRGDDCHCALLLALAFAGLECWPSGTSYSKDYGKANTMRAEGGGIREPPGLQCLGSDTLEGSSHGRGR
jgi:hypothetical protein